MSTALAEKFGAEKFGAQKFGAERAGIAAAADPAERIRLLQSRIREMQATTLPTRGIATHPMFANLLPDGMMQAGSSYSVLGSLSLTMSMLAAPTSAGSWCAVVGVPEFGAAAAAAHGVDLSRLVVVPDAGSQWLAVTAALVDVLAVVVVRPSRRVSDSDAARLSARMRKRDAVLISLGDWPGSDARLTLQGGSWQGIGDGHGMITSRRAQIVVESRGRPPRRTNITLPPPAPITADEHEIARHEPKRSVPVRLPHAV